MTSRNAFGRSAATVSGGEGAACAACCECADCADVELSATATYTDADIAAIPEGSAARSTFETDFIEAVETAMSDVRASAAIDGIEAGSIVVAFTVTARDVTEEAATESFEAMASGMQLAIAVNGTAQAAPVVAEG